MQSDSQQTLSRTHEIENLRRQIAELNEQAETATQEMENIKQRLTNQEKLVNEVRRSLCGAKTERRFRRNRRPMRQERNFRRS